MPSPRSWERKQLKSICVAIPSRGGSGRALRRQSLLYLPLLLVAILFNAVLAYGQNVSDSTPPEVSSVSFGSTSVNTTSGSQNATVSVNATDDLSGVNYLYVYLRTTSTSQPNNTRSYLINTFKLFLDCKLYETE
jgi:hypothetical protein